MLMVTKSFEVVVVVMMLLHLQNLLCCHINIARCWCSGAEMTVR